MGKLENNIPACLFLLSTTFSLDKRPTSSQTYHSDPKYAGSNVFRPPHGPTIKNKPITPDGSQFAENKKKTQGLGCHRGTWSLRSWTIILVRLNRPGLGPLWEVTCRFLPDQSMRLLHPLFPHFLCTTLTCPLFSRWGQRLRFLWPYFVLSDSHIRLVFHTYLF